MNNFYDTIQLTLQRNISRTNSSSDLRGLPRLRTEPSSSGDRAFNFGAAAN